MAEQDMESVHCPALGLVSPIDSVSYLAGIDPPVTPLELVPGSAELTIGGAQLSKRDIIRP